MHKIDEKPETKVTYSDTHSRRNNLIIVGLRERLLESGNPDEELAALLRYILDQSETESALEVDRHHRSPRPRPDLSDPPYIVRLLRWSDRQLILRAAAEKGNKLAEKKKRLEWENKPIHVFQDLPPEMQVEVCRHQEEDARNRSPVWSVISSKTHGHFGWPETYLQYSGTSFKGLDNTPPVFVWIRHWLR